MAPFKPPTTHHGRFALGVTLMSFREKKLRKLILTFGEAEALRLKAVEPKNKAAQ